MWENRHSARKTIPTRLTFGIQRTKNIVCITRVKIRLSALDTKYIIILLVWLLSSFCSGIKLHTRKKKNFQIAQYIIVSQICSIQQNDFV